MVFLYVKKRFIIIISVDVIKLYDLDSSSEKVFWDEEIAQLENSVNGPLACSCISPSEKYLSVCDDDKKLLIWDLTEMKKLNTRALFRRCSSVCFTYCEKYIVVADKPGDIYSFSLLDDSPGILVAGHLSLLLDVKVTIDNYILSCDKDNKIRISCYPNGYNIHGYCLGHENLVSKLVILNDSLFVSGSADGSIRIWNYLSCVEEFCIDCKQNLPSSDSEETTKDLLIVKNIYFNGRDRLIVSFLNKVHVIVYMINLICPDLKVLGIIDVPASPWDISIDEYYNIFVLGPSEDNPLLIYQCESGTCTQIEPSKLDTFYGSNFSTIFKAVNDSWSFFASSVSAEDIISANLRTYEFSAFRIDEYYKNKEDRIEKLKTKKLKLTSNDEDVDSS